eukprot:5510774-Prymnesium_polylepis.1
MQQSGKNAETRAVVSGLLDGRVSRQPGWRSWTKRTTSGRSHRGGSRARAGRRKEWLAKGAFPVAMPSDDADRAHIYRLRPSKRA